MSSAPTRVALITGANRIDGIGYTVARQLALQHDFKVLLGSRTISPSLDEAVKQLEKDGANHGVFPLQIDVASAESIHKAAKEVEERVGKLDVSLFSTLDLYTVVLIRDVSTLLNGVGSGEQCCRGHIILTHGACQSVPETSFETYGT